jgi:hypothetical protein
MKGQSQEYDPVLRRGSKIVDFGFAEKIVVPKLFNKANV